MLIDKPHQKKSAKDNFLTKELQFNEEQQERFQFLDEAHRMYMRKIDAQLRDAKDELFSSFSDTTFLPKTITDKIGNLESKKEEEIYAFFKQVRKLCDEDQAKKFDQIIKKALHKRGPKGRKPKRRPPPK
jgi:DNA-directed RNA polymerase subunit F